MFFHSVILSHQQAEQCLSSLFTYLCLGDHRYSKYLSEHNELFFFFLAMSITLSYVWIYLGKIFFILTSQFEV